MPNASLRKRARILDYGQMSRNFLRQPILESIVSPLQVVPLQLINEAHYHGDAVLCPFGPNQEYLLAYLEALAPAARNLLKFRFGDRLIPLSASDGAAFAANSFQVEVDYHEVNRRGAVPCPVDLSEFLEKRGGRAQVHAPGPGGVLRKS